VSASPPEKSATHRRRRLARRAAMLLAAALAGIILRGAVRHHPRRAPSGARAGRGAGEAGGSATGRAATKVPPATPRLSLEEAHQALLALCRSNERQAAGLGSFLDPLLREKPGMTSLPDVAYIGGWIVNLAERQFERTDYSIETHTTLRGVFDPPAGGQGWRARLVERRTERNPPGVDVGEYRPDYPPGRSPAPP